MSFFNISYKDGEILIGKAKEVGNKILKSALILCSEGSGRSDPSRAVALLAGA